jgi:serine/threonine protein phosphatase PrpC
MVCTLDNHGKKYHLSQKEQFLAMATGMSGLPYAKRHFKLANQSPGKAWGHQGIGIFQSLPLLGGFAMLTERIVVLVRDRRAKKGEIAPKPLDGRVAPIDKKNQPQAASIDQIAQKMWKNGKKAIEEHQKKDPSGGYASLKKGLPSLEELANHRPEKALEIKHEAAEAQGVRPTMEDAHFFKEIAQGVIAGVFDGHGGSSVANYANKQFAMRFSDQLEKCQGNVREAFQSLIDEIHEEIVQLANNKSGASGPFAFIHRNEWHKAGTTAVICFLDKKTHKIYTATLGDSEANIYRKIDGKMKSIPISCVRDWSSKKDAARAAIATSDPDKAINWPKAKDPKALRFPGPDYGLNVSRAIGDVGFSYFATPLKDGEVWEEGKVPHKNPGVIHKAKITLNQVQPGDRIVIGCDGLKDFVPEKEIAKMVDLNPGEGLAKKLVDHAIGPKKSQDNVTVLVLDVKC